MSEQEQFHDAAYCRQEILEVRKYIGDKRANEHTFRSAFDCLTMMLIHCPEEMLEPCRAQLLEANTRYTYAMLLPGFFSSLP